MRYLSFQVVGITSHPATPVFTSPLSPFLPPFPLAAVSPRLSTALRKKYIDLLATPFSLASDTQGAVFRGLAYASVRNNVPPGIGNGAVRF